MFTLLGENTLYCHPYVVRIPLFPLFSLLTYIIPPRLGLKACAPCAREFLGQSVKARGTGCAFFSTALGGVAVHVVPATIAEALIGSRHARYADLKRRQRLGIVLGLGDDPWRPHWLRFGD
jgi:hypothetical protein